MAELKREEFKTSGGALHSGQKHEIEVLRFCLNTLGEDFTVDALDIIEILNVYDDNMADGVANSPMVQTFVDAGAYRTIRNRVEEGLTKYDVLDKLLKSRGMFIVQKHIIHLCNQVGKPVITATQMLDSMTQNPRPTRAEASDVYNAILDGTDAIMLSNETAAGEFPVQAVETMTNIATIAEQHIWDNRSQKWITAQMTANDIDHGKVANTISEATYQISKALNPKAIVTATLTGHTARRVAKERPNTPILCVTPQETTYRRMALVWGVHPLLVRQFTTIDDMISIIVRTAHDEGLVAPGDTLVILAGVPFGVGGQTNLLKIHMVGEAGEI